MSSEKIRAGRPAQPPDPKTLGGQIRLAREKAGYKDQESFAKLVGISRVSLSRIETNVNKPTPQVLHVINSLLGTEFRRTDIGREVKLPAAQPASGSVALPILARIAAGGFSDAEIHGEHVELPRWMLNGREDCFGAYIVGDSMKDAGIFHADVVVLRPTAEPHNHETVVVETSEGATIKEWIRKGRNSVELRPRNSDYDRAGGCTPVTVMTLHAKDIRRVHEVVAVIRVMK